MIGKTISHYRTLEKLGEGGMGVVYKAEDTTLRRTVALKFLPANLTRDAHARERFMREAQAAAALNHPGICTVYEIAEADDGIFIAMEHIEGRSLRAELELGPLDLDRALHIASQVAEALQEAHDRGVVHRDIKPANIMVTPKDRAKITDFGLARLSGSTLLTEAGTLLGTVAYMSPEQARGATVDHRTDIWSLGVALYEMVTGRRPFDGDHPQAIIYSILNDEPPPMSSAPQPLARIVEGALVRNPEFRYQKAAEMAADLKEVRQDPQSRTLTLRRAPLAVHPSIAVMPFVDMSPGKDQEYFCDGMAEEIINALTQLEGLRVIARTSAFAFKDKNEDIREIGRKLDVATLLEGSVRKAGNRLRITAQLVTVTDGSHLWSERYDRELDDVFAIQDEITVSIVERLKIELTPHEKTRLTATRQAEPEAYEAYLRANHYLARHFSAILRDPQHQERVIELFQYAIDKKPDYALAWAGLADAYSVMCRWVSPETYCPKARAAAMKALELDETLAEVHTAMARVYLGADSDWEAARREHERAIELNPGSAMAHCEYGMHLIWEGWMDEGAAEMKRALELDPFDYLTNGAVGLFLIYARRYDEAHEQIEVMRELFPGNQFVERIAASCYVRMGTRLDEAIATMERLGFFGVCIGTAYVTAGRRDKALEYIAGLEEEKGVRHTYKIAVTYAALGDRERAFEWLERTYTTAPQDLTQVNADVEFDFLRSDPRFQALMRRAGIPGGQLEELSQ